jgi:hypothetical protein
LLLALNALRPSAAAAADRRKAGERRLRDVEREARSCDVPALDRDEIERAARSHRRGRCAESFWPVKLTMEPVRVGRKGAFDFKGEAALGRLLTGVVGFPCPS